MDKRRIVLALRAAKKSHMRWVMLAQALTEGVPVEKRFVPKEFDACDFGRWYHGEGLVLMGFQEYGALDIPHRDLHGVYQEIFELLFGREHKNWVTRLLSPQGMNHRNMGAAQARMPELRRWSGEMVDRLNQLERRVLAMSAEEIAGLIPGQEGPSHLVKSTVTVQTRRERGPRATTRPVFSAV